jgi:hypothetical protein
MTSSVTPDGGSSSIWDAKEDLATPLDYARTEKLLNIVSQVEREPSPSLLAPAGDRHGNQTDAAIQQLNA